MREWALRAFLAVLTVLGASIGACSGGEVKPQSEQIAFQKPRFEFKSVQYKSESFSGMEVGFQFDLAFLDSREVKLLDCPYQIDFQGLPPLRGLADVGASGSRGRLAAGFKLSVVVNLRLPWPKTQPELVGFLAQKKIPYTFRQECVVEGPEGRLTVSAGDSGTAPLPLLPEMSITGAKAQRFGSDMARLTFELSILNENSFKVKVDRIVYKIMLEGKPFAEGELPVAESIPPSNETTFDIPSEIRSGEMNREILSLLKRPQIRYGLEGQVFMGELVVPVHGDGTISFAH